MATNPFHWWSFNLRLVWAPTLSIRSQLISWIFCFWFCLLIKLGKECKKFNKAKPSLVNVWALICKFNILYIFWSLLMRALLCCNVRLFGSTLETWYTISMTDHLILCHFRRVLAYFHSQHTHAKSASHRFRRTNTNGIHFSKILWLSASLNNRIFCWITAWFGSQSLGPNTGKHWRTQTNTAIVMNPDVSQINRLGIP